MRSGVTSTPEMTLLGEAADWLVRLQSGNPDAETSRALEQWRQRSPAHADAWARAQTVLSSFGQVPQPLAQGTLQRLHRPDRRRLLALLLLAGPAGWLASRELPSHWRGDLRTAIGERREVALPDGSRLVLNTASSVDVAFSADERRLRLRAGEILVTTAHGDSAMGRPFLVETPQGIVRALGTRFSVRLLDPATQVAVFEHAVEIRPRDGESQRLNAGERVDFTATGVGRVEVATAAAEAWARGMLVAQQMRLADLAQELGRYRVGVIRCHPDIADLRVSGAFPLDGDEGLRLLEKTLPLRVGGLGRYWVTIEPREARRG